MTELINELFDILKSTNIDNVKYNDVLDLVLIFNYLSDCIKNKHNRDFFDILRCPYPKYKFIDFVSCRCAYNNGHTCEIVWKFNDINQNLIKRVNDNTFEIIKQIIDSELFDEHNMNYNVIINNGLATKMGKNVMSYMSSHEKCKRKIIIARSIGKYSQEYYLKDRFVELLMNRNNEKQIFNLFAYDSINIEFFVPFTNDNINCEINNYVSEYINLKLPINDDMWINIFSNAQIYQNTNHNIYERIKMLLCASDKISVDIMNIFYTNYIVHNRQNSELLDMIMNTEVDVFVHIGIISNLLNDKNIKLCHQSKYNNYMINATIINIMQELFKKLQIINDDGQVHFNKLIDSIIFYIKNIRSTIGDISNNICITHDIHELVNTILVHGYQLSQEQFKMLCENKIEMQIDDQTNIILNDEIYNICSDNAFYPNYKFVNINDKLHGLRRLFTSKTIKLTGIKKYMKLNSVVPDHICLENAMINKLTPSIISFLLDNKCIPTKKIIPLCDKKYSFVLMKGIEILKEQIGIDY